MDEKHLATAFQAGAILETSNPSTEKDASDLGASVEVSAGACLAKGFGKRGAKKMRDQMKGEGRPQGKAEGNLCLHDPSPLALQI